MLGPGDVDELGAIAAAAYGLGLREIRLYANEAMTENLSYYPRHGYAETTGPSKTDSIACSSASPSTDPTRGN